MDIMNPFYCDMCDLNLFTHEALQSHNRSPEHQAKKLDNWRLAVAEQIKAGARAGIFFKESGFQTHTKTSKDHRNEPNRLNAYGQVEEIAETSTMAQPQTAYSLQSPTTTAQPASNVPYCDLCEREFVTENGLQSHVEKSQVHKKEVRKRVKAIGKEAALGAGTVSSTGYQSCEQEGGPSNGGASMKTDSRFPTLDEGIQAPVDRRGLDLPTVRVGGYRVVRASDDGKLERRQSDLPTAKVIGFRVVQASDDEKSGVGKDGDERWSVIRASEQLVEFQALSEKCHSLDDLQRQSYLLRPFEPKDIAGLRKCKNCNGTFQITKSLVYDIILIDFRTEQKFTKSRRKRMRLSSWKAPNKCKCIP